MDQIEYVLYIGEPDVVSFESHLELKSNVTLRNPVNLNSQTGIM